MGCPAEAPEQRRCEGCDIVQSDHAPQAGVAQGIFDGELVRRRVGHQAPMNFVPTFYHSSYQVSLIDRDIGR